MAVGARRLPAHEEVAAMMRMLLVALFGYATYRLARAFVRSVPDDFEPIGLLPPPASANAAAHSRPKRAAAGRGRARG